MRATWGWAVLGSPESGYSLTSMFLRMRSVVVTRLILISAVLVVLSACSSVSGLGKDLEGVELPEPTPKPSFTLTDTNGVSYDFAAETEGKLTLLYFGYTSCPDICPVHLAQIAETFDVVPELGDGTAVVFVSIDPDRDSPDEIRAFLDNFDNHFIGLTGSPEELETAQKAAGVAVAFKEGDGDDYTMGHAGQVLAWAPDGMMYSQYPFGTRQSTWVNDLSILAKRR